MANSNNPFLPGGVRPPDSFVPALSGVRPGGISISPTVTPLEGDVVYHYAGDRVLDTSGSFVLDIDGSGSREIAFEYLWQSTAHGEELQLLASAQDASGFLSDAQGAALLAEGAPIGQSPEAGRSWAARSAVLARRPTVSGNPGAWSGAWVGASRAYMGLQIATDEGTCYGWLRLSIAQQSGQLTIHGYAFRVTREMQIPAGLER